MIYIPIININGQVDTISREFFTSEERVKRFIKDPNNAFNDFISCYKRTVKPLWLTVLL